MTTCGYQMILSDNFSRWWLLQLMSFANFDLCDDVFHSSRLKWFRMEVKLYNVNRAHKIFLSFFCFHQWHLSLIYTRVAFNLLLCCIAKRLFVRHNQFPIVEQKMTKRNEMSQVLNRLENDNNATLTHWKWWIKITVHKIYK